MQGQSFNHWVFGDLPYSFKPPFSVTMKAPPMRAALLVLLLVNASYINAAGIISKNLDCSIALGPINLNLEAYLDKPWIDKKFTAPFLKSLNPHVPNSGILGMDMLQLRSLDLLEFKNDTSQHSVQFSMQLFSRPNVDGTATVVPIILMNCKSGPCGLLALAISLDKTGTLTARTEYLKTDPNNQDIRGIAPFIFPMLKKYYSELGVKEETIESGWKGRMLWANEGFELDKHSPFTIDGQPTSQIALIRANFLRFLKFHNVQAKDLYYLDQSGQKKSLDMELSALQQPTDFLRVFHRDNLTISARAYVDVDTLEEAKPYAPGLAFTLWDYRPRPDQIIQILQDGSKPISDIAMPTWIGVRRF